MRLGKVGFFAYYVVDLDNEEMVEQAMIDIEEDVYNAVKYGEVWNWITIDKDATGLTEGDIPEFLKGEEE